MNTQGRVLISIHRGGLINIQRRVFSMQLVRVTRNGYCECKPFRERGNAPIINPIIGETVPGDVTSILGGRPFPLVYWITITAACTAAGAAIDISFLSFAPTPPRQLIDIPRKVSLSLRARADRRGCVPRRKYSFVAGNNGNIGPMCDVIHNGMP